MTCLFTAQTILKALVTVNYIGNDGKEMEIDLDMEAIDLNAIYKTLEIDYPTFTSAVVAFSKMEDN